MPAGYIIYVPDVSRLSLGMTKQENTVFCISAKEEFNPINKSEGSFSEVPILQLPLWGFSLSQGACPCITRSFCKWRQIPMRSTGHAGVLVPGDAWAGTTALPPVLMLVNAVAFVVLLLMRPNAISRTAAIWTYPASPLQRP